MTPEEVGGRLVTRLGGRADAESAGEAGTAQEAATVEVSYGTATVDVPAARWVEAAALARDDEALAATYFDWLSAVDELADGFAVVLHLWSADHRHHVLLRTRVSRDDPRLPTLTGVFAGAAWHERETHEMFGIVFDGHPGLAPLLLAETFEGHPLRKDFVLAARVAKDWPGAREPGESHQEGAPRRGRMRPPGVPEPGTWGPPATGAEPSAGSAAEPGDGAP